MSAPIYHKRQTATAILVPVAAAAVVVAAAAWFSQPAVIPIALLPLVLGYLFSSLTIIVDRDAVRWHFGPGFWRKSASISEIESAGAVRNKWWYGWGIRYTPHGWLYNVGGLSAVELRLSGGRKVRIGTSEPQQVVAAINDAIAARSPR